MVDSWVSLVSLPGEQKCWEHARSTESGVKATTECVLGNRISSPSHFIQCADSVQASKCNEPLDFCNFRSRDRGCSGLSHFRKRHQSNVRCNVLVRARGVLGSQKNSQIR